MTTVKVNAKYQVTLVEEVRKYFPNLKPGDKVLVEYDPVDNSVRIKKQIELEKFAGILKDKVRVKFDSVEAEKKAYDKAMIKYYKDKYAARH